MPKSKKTEAKKSAQRQRTRQNQQKKYLKLIEKYPNSKDKRIWEKYI